MTLPRLSLPLLFATSAVFLTSGCWGGMLEPPKLDPIVTHAQVKGPNKSRLSLAPDGTLLLHPPLGDVEAALGCSLSETPEGLRVDQLLVAETPLREGDLIVGAKPYHHQVHRETSTVAVLASSTALRMVQEEGHKVGSVSDLEGYTLTTTRLLLHVQRDGGEEAAELLVGAPRVLPQQLWRPDLTRPMGFTACKVHSLFPDHVEADNQNLLVTWVAEGSRAAHRGVRPLGLISYSGMGEIDLGSPLVHVAPRTREEVRPPKPTLFSGADLFPAGLSKNSKPTHLEFLGGGLGVMSVQLNGVDDWLVTVGPFGTCLSYRSETEFDPDYADYVEVSTWSTVGFSAETTTYGERGAQSEIQFLGTLDNLVTQDNNGDDGIFYFFPEGE